MCIYIIYIYIYIVFVVIHSMFIFTLILYFKVLICIESPTYALGLWGLVNSGHGGQIWAGAASRHGGKGCHLTKLFVQKSRMD